METRSSAICSSSRERIPKQIAPPSLGWEDLKILLPKCVDACDIVKKDFSYRLKTFVVFQWPLNSSRNVNIQTVIT